MVISSGRLIAIYDNHQHHGIYVSMCVEQTVCVCFYLHSVRPGYLAIQKCVQRMPQYLFSLWTAAADDVTGGANASEEVRIDRWR